MRCTRNFGAYARKMLIDGYIIKVDYTEQKKLAAAVSRISTNINLVCRRINSTGHFYDADVAELKERMADVWERQCQREYQKSRRNAEWVSCCSSLPTHETGILFNRLSCFF